MWFMVCHWPQSQEGNWARPHLCKLTWRKQLIRNHVWRGRSKPGCRIVGSETIVWLITEADNQSSLHCVIVSTDVMSDHIGCRDASHGGGCSKTSAYTGLDGLRWFEAYSQLLLWIFVRFCHGYDLRFSPQIFGIHCTQIILVKRSASQVSALGPRCFRNSGWTRSYPGAVPNFIRPKALTPSPSEIAWGQGSVAKFWHAWAISTGLW